MNYQLSATHISKINKEIVISGSKSESNRLLILQKLYPNIAIKNLSDADDAVHMQEALSTDETLVDIGHAGTAMRFLTSFFAIQEGRETILTGSERMQNRPIALLVDALNSLGADISYVDKVGYPPLKIKGKHLNASTVQINGNVSSQYISSLMMIGAKLPKGLTIELLGEITSVPYIEMTLSLLQDLGIDASFNHAKISIQPTSKIENATFVVESDWSSASYFYSIVALLEVGTTIKLSSFKNNSLQGDSCLATIYKHFGVQTTFENESIILEKVSETKNVTLEVDLKNAPDIAQTIAVTCFAEQIACNLSGLHTLKIKETDRLEALKTELTKLGALIKVTDKSLHLQPSTRINTTIAIDTYNDHRMAMAFAPLALKVPIIINDAAVVTKSYIQFWEHMQLLGFEMNQK